MAMWTTTHCFDFLYVILCIILSQYVQNYRPTHGSFHVKSTDGFHGPPPILLKFGTLVGIV